MNNTELKRKRRLKRKKSIRKNITGTADKPRMSIFRSNKRVYVQVIDDIAGATIVSASSLEKDNSSLKLNVESAEKIGALIGERLKEKKIDNVVFDRNGYLYHGVVKAVAEGARKAGIRF